MIKPHDLIKSFDWTLDYDCILKKMPSGGCTHQTADAVYGPSQSAKYTPEWINVIRQRIKDRCTCFCPPLTVQGRSPNTKWASLAELMAFTPAWDFATGFPSTTKVLGNGNGLWTNIPDDPLRARWESGPVYGETLKKHDVVFAEHITEIVLACGALRRCGTVSTRFLSVYISCVTGAYVAVLPPVGFRKEYRAYNGVCGTSEGVPPIFFDPPVSNAIGLGILTALQAATPLAISVKHSDEFTELLYLRTPFATCDGVHTCFAQGNGDSVLYLQNCNMNDYLDYYQNLCYGNFSPEPVLDITPLTPPPGPPSLICNGQIDGMVSKYTRCLGSSSRSGTVYMRGNGPQVILVDDSLKYNNCFEFSKKVKASSAGGPFIASPKAVNSCKYHLCECCKFDFETMRLMQEGIKERVKFLNGGDYPDAPPWKFYSGGQWFVDYDYILQIDPEKGPGTCSAYKKFWNEMLEAMKDQIELMYDSGTWLNTVVHPQGLLDGWDFSVSLVKFNINDFAPLPNPADYDDICIYFEDAMWVLYGNLVLISCVPFLSYTGQQPKMRIATSGFLPTPEEALSASQAAWIISNFFPTIYGPSAFGATYASAGSYYVERRVVKQKITFNFTQYSEESNAVIYLADRIMLDNDIDGSADPTLSAYGNSPPVESSRTWKIFTSAPGGATFEIEVGDIDPIETPPFPTPTKSVNLGWELLGAVTIIFPDLTV